MKILLILFSVLLFIPNFLSITLEKPPAYNNKEQYDPSLAYINSTEKLIYIADSIADKKGIEQNSLTYAITVTDIIRRRFYHGFSKYPLKQNWIAATSEKLVGFGLASIVKPDDILKYNYGGCSQQAILLMEVMKKKNISYRYVGFPHHYATELKFNNNWHFFDPNMEPNIKDHERLESNWSCCADSLKKFYDTTRFKDLDWKFGKNNDLKFGKVNGKYAPNAELFQTTTKYLSKTLWLFPLVIAFYPRRKKHNS